MLSKQSKESLRNRKSSEHITIFCDIPHLSKFGLVTGYNNDWHGESIEDLKKEPRLLSLHILEDEGLAYGSFIFNPRKFSVICFDQFIPMSEHLMLNIPFESVKNVGLLKTPEMREKIMLAMGRHCHALSNGKALLRNENKENQKEINVCNKQRSNKPEINQ